MHKDKKEKTGVDTFHESWRNIDGPEILIMNKIVPEITFPPVFWVINSTLFFASIYSTMVSSYHSQIASLHLVSTAKSGRNQLEWKFYGKKMNNIFPCTRKNSSHFKI